MKIATLKIALTASLLTYALSPMPASAAEKINGVPGSPTATEIIDGNQIPRHHFRFAA